MNILECVYGFFACNAMLGLGIYLTWRQLAFQKTAKSVSAIVKEIRHMQRTERVGRSDQTVTYYAPVVEFPTEDGRLITYESKQYIYPNRFEIGMEIEVLYDPLNPTNAQVYTHFVLIWFVPVAFLVAGSIMAVNYFRFILLGPAA